MCAWGQGAPRGGKGKPSGVKGLGRRRSVAANANKREGVYVANPDRAMEKHDFRHISKLVATNENARHEGGRFVLQVGSWDQRRRSIAPAIRPNRPSSAASAQGEFTGTLATTGSAPPGPG